MRSDLSGSTPMVCEGVLTVAIAVAPLVVVRIGRRLIEHYVDAPETERPSTFSISRSSAA